ncbi:MAG: hypothetical protein U0Q03_18515 [Acidimicrobiales bacterium]
MPTTSRSRAARRHDAGESLLEIVMTVVIIGITVSALVSGLASAAGAGEAHRQAVRSDTVMRNYAEAAKAAARQCVAGQPLGVSYTAPSGYRISSSPASPTCPAVSTTLSVVLSVVSPNNSRDDMTVVVRTP